MSIESLQCWFGEERTEDVRADVCFQFMWCLITLNVKDLW